MILKPNIEKQIAQLITQHFEANNIEIQAPISVKINPFNCTLTIAPMHLKGNPSLGIDTAKFQETNIKLTLQAMLAVSPLQNYVLPKTGTIKLYEYAECQGIDIEARDLAMHMDRPHISETFIAIQDLPTLLAGQLDQPLPSSFVHQIIVPKTVFKISQPNEQTTLDFGEIYFENVSASNIELFKLQGLSIVTNQQPVLKFQELVQKNINILEKDVSAELINNLQTASLTAQISVLIDLLFGDNPIVQETTFKNYEINAHGLVYTIDKITLTVKNKHVLFNFDDIAINREIIEQTFNLKLPLPQQVLFSLHTSINTKNEHVKQIDITTNINEIATLAIQSDAQIKQIIDFLNDIDSTKFENLKINYTDKSLLARVGMFISPHSSAKQFFLNNIESTQKKSNQNSNSDNLLEQIKTFIQQPGTIEITTAPNRTFTFKELDQMSEDEILKLLHIVCRPGTVDLDTQIAQLKQNP